MRQISGWSLVLVAVFVFGLVSVRAQTLPPLSKEQEDKLRYDKEAMERYKIEDSALYQLATADNVETFAQVHGIKLIDNQVQVIIAVNNSSKYALPVAFGTEQTRYQNLIQALVPVDKLLELGRDENVQSVKLPNYPVLDASSATPVFSGKACIGQRVSAVTLARDEKVKAAKVTLEVALQAATTTKAKTIARRTHRQQVRTAQREFKQIMKKTKQECKAAKKMEMKEKRQGVIPAIPVVPATPSQ